jgi:hypothetical protein
LGAIISLICKGKKMKTKIFVGALCIAVALYGCLSRQTVKVGDSENSKKGQITYSGGGGDSYETAIIIKGTPKIKKTEFAVAAEYDYISGLYGKKDKEWIVEEQSMVQEKDRVYDMVRVKILSNAKMHFFYFDITYFSKKSRPSPPPEEK